MAGDPNPDERRFADLGRQLAAGVEAALPGWVVREVRRVADAWSPGLGERLAGSAVDAGAEAAEVIGARVRSLLAADVDEQRSNPMALVRTAVTYPTRVLQAAGVPAVVRDAEAERQFPGDPYDLTPASFSDLDPDLAEVGLAWGAAKAFVVTARRRSEGRR